MSQTATPMEPTATVTDESACNKCSYSLRGLPVTGKCPECGTPVEFSLRGFLLQYASGEYIEKIRAGLSLVLNGILLMIVLGVVGVVVGFVAPSAGPSLQLPLNFLGLIPAIMILLGYWKFSEPDPGFVGRERPDAARKFLRIAVCVQAAAQAFSFVISLLLLTVSSGNLSSAATALGLLTLVVGIAALAAWLVQFFSVMRYTRWMASRVPDHFIIARTRLYIWLLPLIAIVGLIAFFIGPLIALVLYWNLLDRLRKQVKSIIDTGRPAELKGRLA